MLEEIKEYFEYLSNLKPLERPKNTEFDERVFYKENYLELMDELEPLDDFLESIELDTNYLEGR